MDPELELKKKVHEVLSICEGVRDEHDVFCGCDTYDELVELLKSGKKFVAYNGFEPSNGFLHIAQGLITVMNANILIKNGGKMIIYIADWFAKLNGKLGGDLEKIKIVGRYFIEVFKACGLNSDNVEFVWASDLIDHSSGKYLQRVMDISEKFSLTRIKRCCTIMGKKEGDELTASQFMYPLMQCADIFELNGGGIDICQLGNDQRKVNMLAREYASKIGVKPPIILSHKMLMGLKGPKNKMSKSDPDNAIFMEDSKENIEKKIMKAFCNDETENNPIYEYIIHILLRWFNELELCGVKYNDATDITYAFPKMNKTVLKHDVINYLNQILEPVRRHFEKPELKELQTLVAGFRNKKESKIILKSWNVLNLVWEFNYCLDKSPVLETYNIWRVGQDKLTSSYYDFVNHVMHQEKIRITDIVKKVESELDNNTVMCLQEVSGDLLSALTNKLSRNYNLFSCTHPEIPVMDTKLFDKFKLYTDENEYLVTIVPKTMKVVSSSSYKIMGHEQSALLTYFDNACIANVRLPYYVMDRRPYVNIFNELLSNIKEKTFLITGDFNSTPEQLLPELSKMEVFAYLSNSDTRKGYYGGKLETTCIDHVVSSKNIKVNDMKVHKNQDISDHQMIESVCIF